jgi:hypothetical protein
VKNWEEEMIESIQGQGRGRYGLKRDGVKKKGKRSVRKVDEGKSKEKVLIKPVASRSLQLLRMGRSETVVKWEGPRKLR